LIVKFVKPLNKSAVVTEYADKALALLPAVPTFADAAAAAAAACDAPGLYAGNWDEVAAAVESGDPGKLKWGMEKLVYYWC
jgi:hypothetical protein